MEQVETTGDRAADVDAPAAEVEPNATSRFPQPRGGYVLIESAFDEWPLPDDSFETIPDRPPLVADLSNMFEIIDSVKRTDSAENFAALDRLVRARDLDQPRRSESESS